MHRSSSRTGRVSPSPGSRCRPRRPEASLASCRRFPAFSPERALQRSASFAGRSGLGWRGSRDTGGQCEECGKGENSKTQRAVLLAEDSGRADSPRQPLRHACVPLRLHFLRCGLESIEFGLNLYEYRGQNGGHIKSTLRRLRTADDRHRHALPDLQLEARDRLRGPGPGEVVAEGPGLRGGLCPPPRFHQEDGTAVRHQLPHGEEPPERHSRSVGPQLRGPLQQLRGSRPARARERSPWTKPSRSSSDAPAPPSRCSVSAPEAGGSPSRSR